MAKEFSGEEKPTGERAAPRKRAAKKADVTELAVPQTVPLGDDKTMQTLLQTFANDGHGNMTREFDAKAEDRGFSQIGSYRQLVAAVGAAIGPLADGAKLANADGISLELTRHGRASSHCKMTMNADTFMRVCATYGFDPRGKLDAKALEKWPAIETEVTEAMAQKKSTAAQR